MRRLGERAGKNRFECGVGRAQRAKTEPSNPPLTHAAFRPENLTCGFDLRRETPRNTLIALEAILAIGSPETSHWAQLLPQQIDGRHEHPISHAYRKMGAHCRQEMLDLIDRDEG